MSWETEIEEIHQRRQLAESCGGADAVARHHAEGKLTVRERIAALFYSIRVLSHAGHVVDRNLELAAAAGANVFDGLEVLVAQGAASFELWTGLPAPVAAMRGALGLR